MSKNTSSRPIRTRRPSRGRHDRRTRKPRETLHLVGYSDGGWGDLFEDATLNDLESDALYIPAATQSPASGKRRWRRSLTSVPPRLDCTPQIRAYESAGIAKENEGDPIRRALHTAQRVLRPHVVTSAEFASGIADTAAHIWHALSTDAAWANAPRLVFVLEKRAVKSSLWIFLRIMLEMKTIAVRAGGAREGAAAWQALRSRIYVSTDYVSGSDAQGLALPRAVRGRQAAEKKGRRKASQPSPSSATEGDVFIFTDDALYSGSQMTGYVYGMAHAAHKAAHPVAVAHVCPVYATTDGLSSVLDAANAAFNHRDHSARVSSWVYQIKGHTSRAAAETLANADVALCVKSPDAPASTPYVIYSLFSTLGAVTYHIDEDPVSSDMPHSPLLGGDSDSYPVVNGGAFTVSAFVNSAAFVFQHKVADRVSIPTKWVLVGPTLRAELHNACTFAGCDTSSTRVHLLVCHFGTLMRRLAIANKAHGEGGFPPRFSALRASFHRSALALANAEDVDTAVRTPEEGKKHHGGAQVFPRASLSRMPHYAPLLTPITACGDILLRMHDTASSGDTLAAFDLQAEGLLSGTRLPCTYPAYKVKLRERIGALFANGRAHRFVHLLGLTHSVTAS